MVELAPYSQWWQCKFNNLTKLQQIDWEPLWTKFYIIFTSSCALGTKFLSPTYVSIESLVHMSMPSKIWDLQVWELSWEGCSMRVFVRWVLHFPYKSYRQWESWCVWEFCVWSLYCVWTIITKCFIFCGVLLFLALYFYWEYMFSIS